MEVVRWCYGSVERGQESNGRMEWCSEAPRRGEVLRLLSVSGRVLPVRRRSRHAVPYRLLPVSVSRLGLARRVALILRSSTVHEWVQ